MIVSSLAALALFAQVPFETAPPRRYGDQGSHHFGVGLGFATGGGGFRYAGEVDYAYFVLDGVAPGVQLSASGGSDVVTSGMTLGTLRLVPLRTESLSVFVVGRGGRVFVADHADGWGAGAGGGVIFFLSGRVGLQVAYDYLRLFPGSFCADFAGGCDRGGLALGIVAGF